MSSAATEPLCPGCGRPVSECQGDDADESPAAYPFGNPAAGRPPTTDPFAPCGVCGHDPKNIVLDPDVWTKIIWAAKDSEDWQLRTLIEQAVMGPKR